MSDPNPLQLRVVHALRLTGFADVDVIVKRAGLSGDAVARELDTLTEAGMVRYRDGALSGYSLTPDGRAYGERLLMDQLVALDAVDQVRAIYGDFLELNRPFLQLCSDWQTRTINGEMVINEHADPDYDAEVIARLGAIHLQITAVVDQLANQVDRFGGYGPRFTAALTKVNAGDTEWFTKALIDSYHTVWFELHEDLLATLNLERSKEVPA